MNGTPLESGKISESQPVELFSAARKIANQGRAAAAAVEKQKDAKEKQG